VLLDCTMNGREVTRHGNVDPYMVPHQVYPCLGEDKWVSIAVATDEEFEALCRAAGHPEWAENERFIGADNRWRHRAELDRLIEGWTGDRSHTEVTRLLQEAGVAAAPSCNSEDLWNDHHLRERNFWTKVEHPLLGEQTVIAPVWKYSDGPLDVRGPAPLFGEHNRYVFGELLGLADDEIDRLIAEQVIY